ncbi:hypothetical protein PMAYCL1PPCAC_26406, partial [Pristionchus mayeri]
SAFVWFLPLIAAFGFFIGKCERQVYLDGTFWDRCTRNFAYNGTFPEYDRNPALYDTAQIIRIVFARCCDVLAILSFLLYILIASLPFRRRRRVSSSKWSNDLKILSQGLVVLIYLVGSAMAYFIRQYSINSRKQTNVLMQFMMFLFPGLDVITITVIPLSISLTVKELRTTPREILAFCQARTRGINRLVVTRT